MCLLVRVRPHCGGSDHHGPAAWSSALPAAVFWGLLRAGHRLQWSLSRWRLITSSVAVVIPEPPDRQRVHGVPDGLEKRPAGVALDPLAAHGRADKAGGTEGFQRKSVRVGFRGGFFKTRALLRILPGYHPISSSGSH
jgi:hypothetical protein